MSNTPIKNLSSLYIYGLVSNVASNTTISVAAGMCRDDQNIMDLELGYPNVIGNTVDAPITLNVAVNGINGLDQGSIEADEMYALYLIGDSSYRQPVGAILSLNLSEPTMPVGYDAKRLIGYIPTGSAGVLVPYTMLGNGNSRKMAFDPLVVALNAGAATTFTDVFLDALVPAVDGVLVDLQVEFTPATADDNVVLRSAGSASVANIPLISGPVAGKITTAYLSMVSKLDTNRPVIQYINSAASGATTISIMGYTVDL